MSMAWHASPMPWEETSVVYGVHVLADGAFTGNSARQMY